MPQFSFAALVLLILSVVLLIASTQCSTGLLDCLKTRKDNSLAMIIMTVLYNIVSNTFETPSSMKGSINILDVLSL